MSVRAVVALFLLVAAVACERFAYYATRSVLSFVLVQDLMMTRARVSTLFTVLTWGSLLASVIAGAIAIAIGPRITAAVGAGIAAIGMMLIAMKVAVPGAIVVVGVGAGLFRACPLAAAAEIVTRELRGDASFSVSTSRFPAVAAFSCATYLAINVSAASAPLISSKLRFNVGHMASLGTSFAAALVASVLVAIAAFVGAPPRDSAIASPGLAPYREAPMVAAQPPEPSAMRAMTGLAIFLVPQFIYALATPLTEPSVTAHTSLQRAWLFSVNPIVVIGVCAVFFAIWAGAAARFWSMTLLRVAGAGLVVFAVGLLFFLPGEAPAPLAFLGALVSATGEALIGPTMLAYAALAAPPRFSALVVAGWMAIATLTFGPASWLADSSARTPLLALVAVILLACGVVALVLGPKAHARFFEARA